MFYKYSKSHFNNDLLNLIYLTVNLAYTLITQGFWRIILKPLLLQYIVCVNKSLIEQRFLLVKMESAVINTRLIITELEISFLVKRLSKVKLV